jgi:hypothetical protein
MSTPAEAEEMQSLGEVFECLGYELAARNKLIGRILDDGIYKSVQARQDNAQAPGY